MKEECSQRPKRLDCPKSQKSKAAWHAGMTHICQVTSDCRTEMVLLALLVCTGQTTLGLSVLIKKMVSASVSSPFEAHSSV